MKIPSTPFTICALTPLYPGSEETSSSDPVMVDLYSLDDVIAQLSPSLYIPAPREDCPAGGITLRFSRMKDFSPEGIVSGNDYLKDIDTMGRYISEAVARGGITG
jgi:predicted component of type VI protein secretion system